jgi:hypothetical protein
MNGENLNQLFRNLKIISLMKGWLPLRWRGWVNSLGLYIQARPYKERETILKAGGRFRSYLDVNDGGGEDWQIIKFDKNVWENRFAQLVEPTWQIAYFLNDRITRSGELDNENASAFTSAIQKYKDTRTWQGLPNVPKMSDEGMKKLTQKLLYGTKT